jgi:general secretion pathway protein J
MQARNGFTLVELLVALAIFGLIAAAGVSLLSISVQSQARVTQRLDSDGDTGRILSMLGQDFAQAAPRAWRDALGSSRSALELGRDGALITYIRSGGESGSSRIMLRLEGKVLVRQSISPVDGDSKPRRMTLATGVDAVQIRVRQRGQWTSNWRPISPDRLPDAVELVVAQESGPVRMLFLVGAGQ